VKAQRRYEGQKRAKRVLRIMRQRNAWEESRWPELYADDSEIAHRMVHTRAACSCYMCGNPRRQFGEKTVQERRADEMFAAELETL